MLHCAARVSAQCIHVFKRAHLQPGMKKVADVDHGMQCDLQALGSYDHASH